MFENPRVILKNKQKKQIIHLLYMVKPQDLCVSEMSRLNTLF